MEPKAMHPATEAILRFFNFAHLPDELAAVSGEFCYLAHTMAALLPDGPETTVCLRKLLEAKDCAVRAQIRALTEWSDGFVKAMNDTLRRLVKATKPLVDAVWDGYRAAGAPYGESEEGMLRWLDELGGIARSRWEAERLESIQESCAQLRARRR